jgi:hypothetical protein
LARVVCVALRPAVAGLAGFSRGFQLLHLIVI